MAVGDLAGICPGETAGEFAKLDGLQMTITGRFPVVPCPFETSVMIACNCSGVRQIDDVVLVTAAVTSAAGFAAVTNAVVGAATSTPIVVSAFPTGKSPAFSRRRMCFST